MTGMAVRNPVPQSQRLVCQFCRYKAAPRAPFVRYASSSPMQQRGGHAEQGPWRTRKSVRAPAMGSPVVSRRLGSTVSRAAAPVDPETALREVSQDASTLQESDTVPSDDTVVELLRRCQGIAEALVLQEVDQKREQSSTVKDEGNAISFLLELEEKNNNNNNNNNNMTAKRRPVAGGNNSQVQLAHTVSQIATDIVKDEKVFLSPDVLACYTKTQTLLKRADHFPEIFHLYAHKPAPEENTKPIKFRKATPNSVKCAVPSDLATMALDVAIEQRNLPLVLAIVDNAFCTPAFHRAKVFKKAGVPLGGLALAPAGCYVVSSWAAGLQNTMDPGTATGIAFAAGLAYVGGVSSIGVLAITTANDQMERVTWLPGVPLRHRWLREEERAAMDKVALAWGFKSIDWRGEEEGEEWEALREFIGMRGMILDKTDLMPGMQ